jgi:peptidoglycan/xylan/chitin deacetylase (PgdA/CDA1 family)
MPILRRLGVPATFFLSGASLQAPFSFWYERPQLAFDRGVLDAVELMGRTSEPTHRPASADIHELGEAIMALPPEDRDRVAERLLERIGADRPEAGIRAADVRALVNAGFEIGFHTRHHYALTGLDDDALGRALEEGRAELATEVGGELSMIAYPHGSVDARVASAARVAGYRLGFTAEPRPMGPEDDPILIGRLDPPRQSLGRFALRVARVLRSEPPR